MLTENTTFERHYRIGELAELWGLGRETVRKLVKDDPGVIKIRLGRKKAHTVYSVPPLPLHAFIPSCLTLRKPLNLLGSGLRFACDDLNAMLEIL
jgi:hypothetical protein